MATRLYLHNATSGITGTLPSTEQSSRTAAANFEAQTTNRSMDTTIGTGQQSLAFVNSSTRSNATLYCTKFVSPNLNQTSVAANTWTYNWACQVSNTVLSNYPVSSADDRNILTAYVWRPSTGAKVSNIFDSTSSNTGSDNAALNQINERNQNVTFSGSAVTCQVNDVIVLEMWVIINTTSASSSTCTVYYDGTTANTGSSGTVVTNHASFLETPENISFTVPPIDMTQTAAKTYSNKFITKV